MTAPRHIEPALAWLTLEHLQDGIAIANPAGELLYMNPAGARIVGLGVVEGPPGDWAVRYGVFEPDGVTPVDPHEIPLLRALRGDAPPLTKNLVVKNAAIPGGVRLFVEGHRLVDEAGTTIGALAVYRDVTEHERARSELQQRETYLQAILDNLPDMAWLKDRDSRFVAVNDALARAVGREPRTLIGLTDLELFPAALAERYRADDRQVIVQRSTLRIEEPLIMADGAEVTLETIKAPVVDHNGEVIGTTGIARDITDRKRAEGTLLHAKEDLERRVDERTRDLERARDLSVRKERLAVLGQLAGGVAHQIRNPLAAIKNATYVLERALPLAGVLLPSVVPGARRSSPLLGELGPDGVPRLSPEQQLAQAVEIIHEEIRRANDIISGLLDYARVRVPVRQATSLRDLVAQALASVVLPPNITVHDRVGASQAAVDPAQLQEAVHVLVRNAIDAMPDGGNLTIATEESDPWVTLSVEDDGAGLPTEVEGRLFEPLLTTKVMGLGLGLVTARTLVEAQGGQLSFVDPKAHGRLGARFEMKLPAGAELELLRRRGSAT